MHAHYRIILNPHADNGRAGRQLPGLRNALDAEGWSYEIHQTEGPGHATQLARVAYDPALRIIAVGGDGTLHEVCCGVLSQLQKVPVGILPMGTGNDFVKALGMPGTLAEGVEALQAATVQPVDVGWVRWTENGERHQEPFVNAVGIGFDAQVAYFAKDFKHWPGVSGYLAAVFRTLRYWHSPEVRVSAVRSDQEAPLPTVLYHGPMLLTTLGNGVSSGGAFYLTPNASIQDGRLDACVVPNLPLRRILRLIPKVMRGRHENAPELTIATVYTAHLVSNTPLPIHTDGEVVSAQARDIEIEIEPGALPVLMPQQAVH